MGVQHLGSFADHKIKWIWLSLSLEGKPARALVRY
jgi:hypothetical protein